MSDFSIEEKSFIITKENRIDMQKGFQCSAFSTAYVLRHFDKKVDGGILYSQNEKRICLSKRVI